jgi:pimeloyl-ACP methyl ester carboxylesterase
MPASTADPRAADSAKSVNLTPTSQGVLARLPFLKRMLTKIVVGQRVGPKRQELPETPADHGMEFLAVEITASDGVRLSAWEIPAENPIGLVIVNHPLLCTRYGSVEGMDGVTVAFLPMIKHLYDAGYSVLTYDQRGQGESDGGVGKSAKGPQAPVGAGALEWQDAVGVLQYVSQHKDFNQLNIALMSQCMGANAVLAAWHQVPNAFDLDRIKCQVLVQPTISYNMMSRLTERKLKMDLAAAVDAAQRKEFGFGFADALETIGSVKVPVLFTQVKGDVYTTNAETGVNDVEVIFDRCPTSKTLVWIGPDQPRAFGTGKRFDGYNYFNEYPQELLEFLAANVGTTA